MKKLLLKMDELRVESFEVRDGALDTRGTVLGRQTWIDEPCGPSNHGECVPSYEQRCWWTGDPMQDCYPATPVGPCTDYQC